MAASESLGSQFPVVRRTSHYVTQNAGLQRNQVYTAVHPKTGEAVGTIGIEYPSVAAMSGREIDKAFAEAEPGTDVPMFKFFPERVDAFAVKTKGQGVGKHLLNHLMGDLMAAEGRGTARIPNISSNVSPDSAGVMGHYTGQDVGKDQYWTDSGAQERGAGESDEAYAERMGEWRRQAMDQWAEATLAQRAGDASLWTPEAEPGQLIGGNPVHKIHLAPEQETTLDEKMATLPKPAKKRSKTSTLPVSGQLTLPGI